MHYAQTDEVMVPLFAKSSNGHKGKYKYVAGSRNYVTVDWEANTGELKFDIRVERERGIGETDGCVFLCCTSGIILHGGQIDMQFVYHHLTGLLRVIKTVKSLLTAM